jgi:hypothetical protein
MLSVPGNFPASSPPEFKYSSPEEEQFVKELAEARSKAADEETARKQALADAEQE